MSSTPMAKQKLNSEDQITKTREQIEQVLERSGAGMF